MTINIPTADAVPPATRPLTGADMPMQLIAKSCASSGCPTIYMTDEGALVVQGYAVSAAETGLEVPEGELLVKIPAALLAAAARSIG